MSRAKAQALALWINRHRARLLVAMLGLFHLAYLQGVDTAVGKVLLLGHFGLFLLWQPFVRAEASLARRELLLLAASPLLAILGFPGTWLLIAWLMLLSGVVGGRVFFHTQRSLRVFYLLALGYLITMLLVAAVPAVLPLRMAFAEQLLMLTRYGLPLLLMLMWVIPARSTNDVGEEAIDLVFSVFIILLLAVVALGALAQTLLHQWDYLYAVLSTIFATAGLLVLASWLWNPRLGFSGLGVIASRYLLSVGLPLEQWLHRVAELAAEEKQPLRFLDKAAGEVARKLPWVLGGRWLTESGSGFFGHCRGRCTVFRRDGLTLELYTRSGLSPSLIWHFNLVTQVLEQYFRAKQKEQEYLELAYMKAIHETGARLTHDMKNLLQSLGSLVFAAQGSSPESGERLTLLMQRQLPQIVQRLQTTVEKLSAPRLATGGDVAIAEWWNALQSRYQGRDIQFLNTVPARLQATVNDALFSGAMENLLQNALAKRGVELGIPITATIFEVDGRAGLRVEDGGSAILPDIASDIGRRPISSEQGLGIGLLQLARSAEMAGYRLVLEINRPGSVVFCLMPVFLSEGE